MKKIAKLFLQGLMAILPIGLTLYILYWLAVTTESVMGKLIRLLVPEDLYLPGMGIIAGFFIIFAIGILLHVWLFRKLFETGEKLLERVPLIKSLYGSIRDLMSFFDTSKKKEFDKVVMVIVPGTPIRLMGLVTRENFDDLPDNIGDGNMAAVYLPMSYQMGGFTIFIPRENLQPVDMSIEDAMRFILTAAVSGQKAPTPDK